MRFDNLKIGEYFVEIYIYGDAKLFEKKSLSTAWSISGDGFTRNGTARFGKSVKIYPLG